MRLHCSLWLLLSLIAGTANARGQEYSVTFSKQELPDGMSVEGNATVDATQSRPDGQGGSLRIAPETKMVWNLRDSNGSGKAEFWVLDDGRSPTDPKQYAAGPRWGLLQQDGRTQTIGAIYAPYLSGDKTYAASDFHPDKDEQPWWQVQYLGIRRDAKWHKWTYAFDAEEGLRVLYDDQDINARRSVFNWNKTHLLGFTGVVFWGDATDARQSILVDDISIELGPVGETRPLWPPPPPPSLKNVPRAGNQTATPYQDTKVVWNCIECTRISNLNVKPTRQQVRAEVWMSIIHGSRGLIYFVHQFKPDFVEAGLLTDAEMLAAVTKLNRQVHSLAHVINSPTLVDVASVTSSAPHTPVHTIVKRVDGATYLFAVSLYHEETDATFDICGLAAKATAEVIDESRSIAVTNGQFADHFGGYDVHLYRVD